MLGDQSIDHNGREMPAHTSIGDPEGGVDV
jgi:hypothetical protein